jgi:nucleotide sugar dehydrogenase
MTLLVHILKKFSHISGYDINLKKIKNIKKVKLNFYEKNIDTLFRKNLIQKRVSLSNKLSKLKAQIYIVCVGTEIKTSDKINNENLIDVFEKLALVIKKDDLVILRGTVQVGITRSLLIRVLEKESGLNCGKDFFLSYMPERILEGDALDEFEKIPQLVSGYTEKCLSLSMEFSNILFNSSLELKSIEEGEIIKLASNSYRDLSFAFSNELSRISEIYSLSGSNLIEKANFGYERNNFQKPSAGVGGFCLPKDPFLFSKLYKNKKVGYRFSNLSRKINDGTIIDAVKKIENYKKKYFGKNKKLRILIYGLAFKGFPETIDTRNSPAIELFKLLKKNKHIIKLHDVLGKKILLNKTELKPFILSKVKNLNIFDVIILINNHNYYQYQIKKYLKKNNSNSKKLVFDVWNLLNQSYIESQNWIYQNI